MAAYNVGHGVMYSIWTNGLMYERDRKPLCLLQKQVLHQKTL